MKDGPNFSVVAALLGDPARANMMTALMDGRALTATELAHEAGVALSTASGHLSRLVAAGLIAPMRQGRHKYFRLSGGDVAAAIERLMDVAARTGHLRTRSGPRDPALRTARVCYDHLAGEAGVKMFDRLRTGKYLAGPDDALLLTATGAQLLASVGIDIETMHQRRRPLCRACLDWSERRAHLGGALGAAILKEIFSRGWARRLNGSRAIIFTPAGQRRFDEWLR
jgi:DNA-binding transcriptional ArsR family regulator